MWAWTIQKLMRNFGGMGMGRKSWSRPSFEAANEKEQAAFAEKMRPILAEFEQSRQDTYRQVEESTKFWAPLGLAAGIAGAVAATYLVKDAGDFQIACLLGGIAGGMYMATRRPVVSYEDSFKTKVMPHLLARFGDFKLLASPTVSVAPLFSANILPRGKAAIEDEISGQYRGRTISMAELEITSTRGEDTVTHFDGLLLKFELPREVSGRTIICPKAWDERERNQRTNVFGQQLPEKDGLELVALESPEFAKRFTVRSTDQIGARVLLSPAFMERLLKFEFRVTARGVSELSWIEKTVLAAAVSAADPKSAKNGLPVSDRMLADTVNKQLKTLSRQGEYPTGVTDVVAIAENGTLLIGIPKSEHVDYFEPPPYWIETNAEAVLMHLSIDIQNMLEIADAVFDLDYRTRVEDKSGRLVKAA
jgi:hypothetical protein